MIYDEAFEVRVPGNALTLTALIKYVPDSTVKQKENAIEARDGSTDGYITKPDETLLGWFEEKSEERDIELLGCFYGHKIRKLESLWSNVEQQFDTPEGWDLPTNFSWGDPITSPKKMSKTDKLIFNQGSCGSCYALASTFALQKRSEILKKTLLPNQISSQEVVNCSFYGQGCQGGYPFLVGKVSDKAVSRGSVVG